MCEVCWNVDAEGKKSCDCSEESPYVVTFERLKEDVLERWINTGEHHFRIHKKAVFNPPSQSYVWEAEQIDDQGKQVKKETLSLHFN